MESVLEKQAKPEGERLCGSDASKSLLMGDTCMKHVMQAYPGAPEAPEWQSSKSPKPRLARL